MFVWRFMEDGLRVWGWGALGLQVCGLGVEVLELILQC